MKYWNQLLTTVYTEQSKFQTKISRKIYSLIQSAALSVCSERLPDMKNLNGKKWQPTVILKILLIFKMSNS